MKRALKPWGLAVALTLALIAPTLSCASFLRSFTPGAIAGSLAGAASGDAHDQAVVGQLLSAGLAIGKALEDIGPEEEYYLGRAVAATVLTGRRAWGGPEALAYVNRIGQALAMASRLPETYGGYHILITDGEEINAFGAPGGLVIVSRGLLACARTEDEVAAILAHEIAHVSLKHGLKAVKTARWTDAGLKTISYGAAASDSKGLQQAQAAFGDAVDDIVTVLVASGYSQAQEKEADLEAIRLLREVGYDPGALGRVLGRMESRFVLGLRDFSATHPRPELRQAYLEEALRKSPPPPRASAAALRSRQVRYLAALGGL